jgi:hypothetical protein
MRIHELLIEGYPDTIAAFNQVADPSHVKTTIDQYRDLVNRNQVKGNERNIDWWRKQGWEKFSAFVADKQTQSSKTQIKRKRAAGKSITLKETPDWLVVIPLDHDASCFHGRGTAWCTARPATHYFDEYFLDRSITLIYCINKNTGDKYAIAYHPDVNELEMFNSADKSISADEFKSATGFDPRALVKMVPHGGNITDERRVRKQAMEAMRTKLKKWRDRGRHRDKNLEQELMDLKSPDMAAWYVIALGQPEDYYDDRVAYSFPPQLEMMAVRSGLENDIFNELDLSMADYPIAYMRDPSPAVRLASVKTEPYSIGMIARPTEEEQLAAVSKNGYVIRTIEKKGIVPSEAVQLAAVKNYPKSIEAMSNPTAAAIAAAEAAGYDVEGNEIS